MTAAPRSAVASASSTSLRSERGTVSTTEPSNGLRTSIFSALSTHLPPSSIFIGNVLLRRSLAAAEPALSRAGAASGNRAGQPGGRRRYRPYRARALW